MNELIVISSLISILFLLVLFLWLIPGYRVDLFRQQMFALRDELFDEARKGNISFSDPAYGMLRSSMNGFIQFGHRLNVWQVMLLNFIARNEKNRMTKPFYKQLEENMTENTPDAHCVHRRTSHGPTPPCAMRRPCNLAYSSLPVRSPRLDRGSSS